MKGARETQYERTSFSWMRTVVLAILVLVYYLRASHFESNLAFYMVSVGLIALYFSYHRKSKLLLCCTLISLIASYLAI